MRRGEQRLPANRGELTLNMPIRMRFATEINASRRLAPIVSMPTMAVAKLSPTGC
jgi:hypothetical protein